MQFVLSNRSSASYRSVCFGSIQMSLESSCTYHTSFLFERELWLISSVQPEFDCRILQPKSRVCVSVISLSVNAAEAGFCVLIILDWSWLERLSACGGMWVIICFWDVFLGVLLAGLQQQEWQEILLACKLALLDRYPCNYLK